MSARHEFILLAYGRSPHLEACLTSLMAQDRPSRVTICTSTPFPGLETLAARHGVRVVVHEGGGIGADWNAALGVATADLVTLAHQDDLYLPEFSNAVVQAHACNSDAAFSFTDFGEIDAEGVPVRSTLTHMVKRVLTGAAFFGSRRVHGGWRRQILLGFGNPIICAGVTLAGHHAQAFRFRSDMRTNMDWAAWLNLSRRGPVLRIAQRLVIRRAHAESATSACLADGSRLREDAMMFELMWPRPFARMLSTAYRLSYRGYLP